MSACYVCLAEDGAKHVVDCPLADGHDPWASERSVWKYVVGMDLSSKSEPDVYRNEVLGHWVDAAEYAFALRHVWKAIDSSKPDSAFECANCGWIASPHAVHLADPCKPKKKRP